MIYNVSEYKFYALCDQDDYWNENKIIEAVNKIKDLKEPALCYCGMNIVDETLNKIGEYFKSERCATSFKYTSLFGGEISGCTMVFNNQLRDCLKLYNPAFFTMHDTWIHRVSLCCNARILGDQQMLIEYRQHTTNVVGMKRKSFKDRIRLIKQNRNKSKKIAIELLNGYEKQMKEDDIVFLKLLFNNNFKSKIKLSFTKCEFKIGFVKRLKLVLKVFGNRL